MLQFLSGLPNLIRGLSISDVIDILIMTAIVYNVMIRVRTTRAWQLVKGLAILVAATVISDVLHLYTLAWITNKILDIGLIALVIIFQPELRRALEIIGRTRFGKNNMQVSRELATQNVAAITNAIEYLSERREGAIIVIERKTALQDIAETGTFVDSKLTELLLENIFYKGSPLHDGAVIVRRDRILAAGCVLPLTDNQGLSKDLGTRHRAGIGVSEICDGIVLIVSEETGIISMAMDGKLSRFLDIKTVEKTLYSYYLEKFNTNGETNFLRRFLKPAGDTHEDEQNS